MSKPLASSGLPGLKEQVLSFLSVTVCLSSVFPALGFGSGRLVIDKPHTQTMASEQKLFLCHKWCRNINSMYRETLCSLLCADWQCSRMCSNSWLSNLSSPGTDHQLAHSGHGHGWKTKLRCWVGLGYSMVKSNYCSSRRSEFHFQYRVKQPAIAYSSSSRGPNALLWLPWAPAHTQHGLA